MRVRVGEDHRVRDAQRDIDRLVIFESLQHAADDGVADQRPHGVVEQQAQVAIGALRFIGPDCRKRGFVAFGTSEQDMRDFREAVPADEILDLPHAQLVGDDGDFIDALVRLEARKRMGDDRPPPQLHQLFRSRQVRTLADAARKDDGNGLAALLRRRRPTLPQTHP